MEEIKICWICDNHENPYKNHEEFDGTKDNPENFSDIGIIGPNDGSNIPKISHIEYVHEECSIADKYMFGE